MVIKTVLIDLSGTLHIENTATLNAVSALQRLRDAALKVKFVTNTTKESRRCLYERLVGLGFQLKENEIFSSLFAAKALIDEKGWKKPMLMLEPAALEDFAGINQPGPGETADAVVMGLSPSQLFYEKLNIAFRHLLSGAQLVAIHQARYYRENGELSLGPGGFVNGLEYAAECRAKTVGKPTPDFFRAALDGLNPEEAVMIGDDVRDDIKGAQECGIRGFLVKTGKYREGDENKISPPPHSICDNFHQAVELILTEISQS